jgi:hypothetical protein
MCMRHRRYLFVDKGHPIVFCLVEATLNDAILKTLLIHQIVKNISLVVINTMLN